MMNRFIETKNIIVINANMFHICYNDNEIQFLFIIQKINWFKDTGLKKFFGKAIFSWV